VAFPFEPRLSEVDYSKLELRIEPQNTHTISTNSTPTTQSLLCYLGLSIFRIALVQTLNLLNLLNLLNVLPLERFERFASDPDLLDPSARHRSTFPEAALGNRFRAENCSVPNAKTFIKPRKKCFFYPIFFR